jgi:hypothetical protein
MVEQSVLRRPVVRIVLDLPWPVGDEALIG